MYLICLWVVNHVFIKGPVYIMAGGTEVHTQSEWVSNPQICPLLFKALEILLWSLVLFFKIISEHFHLFDKQHRSEKIRVFHF